MKYLVKYITSPLFWGGFVIALYFSLMAFHLRANHAFANPPGSYTTATRLLKSNAPSYCFSIIKKFLSH